MSKFLKFVGPFMARLSAAMLIVFSTFNPTGYSYIHWLLKTGGDRVVFKLAVGVGFFMIYYALLNIAFVAFRRGGMVAATIASVLFVTQLALLIVPHSLYRSWSGYLLVGEYITLVSLAIVLTFGMSWSSFMQRLTGQQQKRYVAGPPTRHVR